MRAIITISGFLVHEYPNGRRVCVECPYSSSANDHREYCGDWCRLWQEPRQHISYDRVGDPAKVKYVLTDCRGHEHTYDELIDEREGVQKEDDK